MDLSPLFDQFVNAYPKWRLWVSGTDLYTLAYNFVSQDVTVGNPEDPGYIGLQGPASLLYLTTPAITNVTFFGGLLAFKMYGYLWVLNGLTGKVSQERG